MIHVDDRELINPDHVANVKWSEIVQDNRTVDVLVVWFADGRRQVYEHGPGQVIWSGLTRKG